MLLILHPNRDLCVHLVLWLERKAMLLNNSSSPYAIHSFVDYFTFAKYSFVHNFMFESRSIVENTRKILSSYKSL